MNKPSLADYVRLIMTLFGRFEQAQSQRKKGKRGRPLTYLEQSFVVFYMLMQFRHIHTFKGQWRWLKVHPEMVGLLGWQSVPHRKTISTRYKALYGVLREFIQFVAQNNADLDEALSLNHLVTDKSLFKANGPVWHQSDRNANHIPDKLRHLDTDATWSKSGYHGWVYGYGLHVLCNESAFPVLVQVETAAVAETTVTDQQEETILEKLNPHTVSADNSYAKALRIRRWAKHGVALLSPAYKWVSGRYAQAYHRLLQQPDIRPHYARRKTSVEPFFDLVSQVLSLMGWQKQLPFQGLSTIRTFLTLGVLSVQIAFLVNSIWGLPLRNVSHIAAAFS
jgi:hypothetical protein